MSSLPPINYETNFEALEPTPQPRYGPLPSLARPTVTIGSAPLHRRLRALPPPAYSDLDECDSDRASEPRYQPMPLHPLSRRPLPSQPATNGTSRGGFRVEEAPADAARLHGKDKPGSSASSDSASGDYEDISQL